MEVKHYFESVKGTGVLATADREGKVDAAVYSRPHFMEDGTLGFIMPDRLTHRNLQMNPHAVYLFVQEGPRYKGCRLFLKKTREEKDTDRLRALRRRKYRQKGRVKAPVFWSFFNWKRSFPSWAWEKKGIRCDGGSRPQDPPAEKAIGSHFAYMRPVSLSYRLEKTAAFPEKILQWVRTCSATAFR